MPPQASEDLGLALIDGILCMSTQEQGPLSLMELTPGKHVTDCSLKHSAYLCQEPASSGVAVLARRSKGGKGSCGYIKRLHSL